MAESERSAQRGATAAGWWLWLSLVVLAADQGTKWLVTRHFELFESVAVNPYLDLTLLHNTGAAFSFLAGAGGWQRWLFISLGVIVSIVILFWLRRLPVRGQSWLAAGLSLVLGGALGNVIDRVHLGYVVDFIHVHYGDAYFPAFNIADSAITVGAACLIIDALFFSGRESAGDVAKSDESGA